MARLKLIIAIFFVEALVICNSASVPDAKNVAEECNLSQDIIDDIAGYAEVVNQIMDYFLQGPFKGETYKRYFIDYFRPSST